MPTRWAAIATLSRITLYAASPWYNGNGFYSDWTRKSDGAHFIPQEKDNTKWGVAAAYAKYIIRINIVCIGHLKNRIAVVYQKE